jgi:hypothetical protein
MSRMPAARWPGLDGVRVAGRCQTDTLRQWPYSILTPMLVGSTSASCSIARRDALLAHVTFRRSTGLDAPARVHRREPRRTRVGIRGRPASRHRSFAQLSELLRAQPRCAERLHAGRRELRVRHNPSGHWFDARLGTGPYSRNSGAPLSTHASTDSWSPASAASSAVIAATVWRICSRSWSGFMAAFSRGSWTPVRDPVRRGRVRATYRGARLARRTTRPAVHCRG